MSKQIKVSTEKTVPLVSQVPNKQDTTTSKKEPTIIKIVMNKINNEFGRPILKSSSIFTFQTKNITFNDDNSVGVGLEDYMDAKFFDFNGLEIVWNLFGTGRVAELFKRFLSHEVNIRDKQDDKHYLLDFAEVFAHKTKGESFEIVPIDKATDKNGKNYVRSRYPNAKFVIRAKYVDDKTAIVKGPYPSLLDDGNYEFYLRNHEKSTYEKQPSHEEWSLLKLPAATTSFVTPEISKDKNATEDKEGPVMKKRNMISDF